jgi:hypothetical protein
MVENVGLGEAIAGGTNLSGQWDNPITMGLQTDTQLDFKRIEKQQAEQARLAKMQDELMKLTSFDEGKWTSPEIARKFKDYTAQNMPLLVDRYKKGDKMGVLEIQKKILDEKNALQFADRGIKSLYELPEKSVTRKSLMNDFNQGGIFKIVEEDSKFNFLPPRIEGYDETTGYFKPKNVPNPNIDRVMGLQAKERLKGVPKAKNIGTKGGTIQYTIDEKDPEYLRAKTESVNNILSNSDLVNQVLYTDDFRDYYKEYLTKNQVGLNEDTEADLEEAMKGFLSKKFDNNKVLTIEKQTTRGGGSKSYDTSLYTNGKRTNNYEFKFDEQGRTLVDYPTGQTPAKLYLEGMEKLGSGEEIRKVREVFNPKISYFGNGKFLVEGQVKEDSEYIDTNPMVVDESQISLQLGLNEKGLKTYFPEYAKEKGATPTKPKTATTTAKAKPATAKKDSYPAWKAKNPNGTPAQYKEYLKK